jgi:acyl dehydratase
MSVPTTTTRLTLDQVSVGDALPTLTYDVTATTIVVGALATRDTRPQHHDFQFATERNGMRNIFLSSPNQLAWFERYLTDWTGPTGRLGRLSFTMTDSVFPGDAMCLAGSVSSVDTDETGCGWVEVAITVTVGATTCTTCNARIALPVSPDDNPWTRRGESWKP